MICSSKQDFDHWFFGIQMVVDWLRNGGASQANGPAAAAAGSKASSSLQLLSELFTSSSPGAGGPQPSGSGCKAGGAEEERPASSLNGVLRKPSGRQALAGPVPDAPAPTHTCTELARYTTAQDTCCMTWRLTALY